MASIQQLIEAAVQPIGLVWILSLLSVVVSVIKRRWLTCAAFGVIVVVMFVFGSIPVPALLLAQLERPYAAGAKEMEDQRSEVRN